MTQYQLVPEPPSWQDYLMIRSEAGLSPRNREQAIAAVANSWAFCHLRDGAGQAVAMGRVIGDGGWYFHLADIATLPTHQRRGLGGQVMSWLLEQIASRAPDDPYVTLIADPPGQPLYRRFGFVPTDPSIAMVLRPAD
ncbi:MAG: GNAT family N-acetyltransferase [Propionicimonas sp.]